MVNQQLLLQNEYLIAENSILRAHLPSRLRLTNPQRSTLAASDSGGALQQVASAAKPETILVWCCKLIAQKFDGSQHRVYPGWPGVAPEVAELVVRMARENSGWGYDRIAGALKNLGYCVSDQTVGNILRRFGIAPAPKRSQRTSWGRLHTSSHGGPGRYGFIHRRGSDLTRLGDLLRSVLSTPERRDGSHLPE